MNARRTSPSARTSRGARPSAPGRTTSTCGQRFVADATVGSPSAAVSVDGHEAASTRHRPDERAAPQRHVADMVVRSPLLAMGRVRLARDTRATRSRTAGRTPPDGSPRRRPRRRPGSGATSGTAAACRRPRTRPRGHRKPLADADTVAGTGDASGTSPSRAARPPRHRPTASTASVCSSSGAGRTTNAPPRPVAIAACEARAVRVRSGREPPRRFGRPPRAAAAPGATRRSLLPPRRPGAVTARPITAASGAT